jgi:diaminopimelate epimerase
MEGGMKEMDQLSGPQVIAGGRRGGAGREGMLLSKYEGLGNDFLVLVDLEGRHSIDGSMARAACERHRGFGADGLLRAGPAGPGAAMSFELRNADGSEAEMSGNGLRCLVHAVLDAGAVQAGAGDSLVVSTPAGLRRVDIEEMGDRCLRASTEMGTPVVNGERELCNVTNGRLLVDVGNPHLVVLGPDPVGLDLGTLGPELGRCERNVELVALGPGKDELTMRVWERGVGETMACGTGSVAAAVAAHYWGRVNSKVTVHQPGGAADVELRPDGVAVLSGPSRRVGRCWLEL